MARSQEHGFSLIELMVALAITLIVSGAIYGLLASGQNAFRREPEITERQQNIRMAMDLIMRDVSNAGAGLGPWVQVFTPNLDACATCPNGGSQAGPTGAIRDELEMITSTARDSEPVCFDAGAATGNASGKVTLDMVRNGVAVDLETPVVLIFDDGRWTVRRVRAVTQGATSTINGCTLGSHTMLDFSTGDAPPLNVTGNVCSQSANNTLFPPMGSAVLATKCNVTQVAFADVVHYRIREDAQGVPVLQRLSTADLNGGFQTIARGIEDLQVQYTQVGASATWLNIPGSAATPPPLNTEPLPANYATLTNQVQVTITARSEARALLGAQPDAGGLSRIRGNLTAIGSPRSTLMHVALGRPSPGPSTATTWYWE